MIMKAKHQTDIELFLSIIVHEEARAYSHSVVDVWRLVIHMSNEGVISRHKTRIGVNRKSGYISRDTVNLNREKCPI